jgi:hypothetical protein
MFWKMIVGITCETDTEGAVTESSRRPMDETFPPDIVVSQYAVHVVGDAVVSLPKNAHCLLVHNQLPRHVTLEYHLGDVVPPPRERSVIQHPGICLVHACGELYSTCTPRYPHPSNGMLTLILLRDTIAVLSVLHVPSVQSPTHVSS